MKFSRVKCEVLHLGRKSPVHQYVLGSAELESSFVKEDLGS